MRIENLKKSFGDFREIVIYLFVYPAAEKGKCLDQPFGVRIVALVAIQLQSAGDFRVFTGELPSHLSDE